MTTYKCPFTGEDKPVTLERFPLPWRVEVTPRSNYDGGVLSVVDANGEEILTQETYSGDGDRIYLEHAEIIALVEIVNKIKP